MKPKFSLRNFLALACSSILVASSASATTLYWDGDIVNGGNPAANANGGVGNWDNSLTNWDTLAAGGADSAWIAGSTAVFSGTGATVTLTDNITVGGLTFNKVNGGGVYYTLDAAANTLSFSSGDNTLLFNNGNGGAPSATITGQLAGSGANVIVSAQSSVFSGNGSAGTLTLNGTSTGGWTGTTTINHSMTLSLAAANRGLANTSGITLNGGAIVSTNLDATQAAYDRFNDSAGITINGGGTFTYTNTKASGRVFAETLGAITLNSGQFNAVLTNDQNSGGGNVQTLTLGSLGSNVSGSGLARTTTTSAVTFSSGTTGPNATTNRIAVYGAGTTSGWVSGDTSNSIIGSWATTGTTAALQNDYAVYNGDYVVAANTAASAETSWTDAAKQYTLSYAALTASSLSATRNIAALKMSSTATTLSSTTVVGSPNFVFNTHGFNVGDAVVLNGASNQTIANFTFGMVYYVASVVDANTITLSSTPGGAAINAGTARTTTTITGGLMLGSGINLGTTGILNSGTASIAIGRTAAGGQISLPTAAAGNLFINAGSGGIAIDAPIVNNGGASNHLTVVKTGSGLLHLSGNNTFSGGIVVNAGTLRLSGDQSFAGGVILSGGAFGDATDGISSIELDSNSVTVNGNASMYITSGETLAGAIAISSTGNLKLNGPTATLSGVVSGSGVLTLTSLSGTTVTLSNTANTHTGVISMISDNNQPIALAVNSLADSASPGAGNIQMGGGGTLGGYTFALHTGAIAPLILNNRQVELVGDGPSATYLFKLSNNSSQAFTINSNLLASGTNVKTLTLGGSGAGLSTFAGTITNGSHTTINIAKVDTASRWDLTNTANTYNGTTTVSQGILGFANGALGSTGTINASGGTLLWLSGNTQDISSRLVMAAGNTTLNTNGNNVAFASAIGSASAGALIKNGLGTLSLEGTNTYTGSTTLNAGTLKLDYATNDASKLSNTATTGTLLLNGGTLELSGGAHVETVLSTTLNTGGTFITQPTGGATLSMGVITYTGGALDFAEAGIANVSTSVVTNGILSSTSGTARVTVGGADWAAKDGSNNVIAYTGYTTGYAGAAMTAATNYSIVDGTSITTNRGAATNTLKITTTAASSTAISTGATLTLGSMLFAGANDYAISTTGTGRIAATLLHNYGAGTLTLGSLGVALTQYGTGKTILSAAAGGDYGMTIAGGTVQISDNLQIGTNAAVRDITLNNGTLLASETLALNSSGLLSRTVTLGAGGGTLAAASTKTLTVSGVISGALNQLTVGNVGNTGTVTLSAVNTYTGPTFVSAGTLYVSGSLASDVTVSDTATIAGGGTVDDLILGGGSFFDLFLAVNSADSLAATNISFAATGFGIDNLLANGTAVNWGDVNNGTYTLITGTLNSTNLGNFGLANAYDIGGGRSAYFQNGSLQLVVIPEPGTTLLCSLGVLLLLRRRR